MFGKFQDRIEAGQLLAKRLSSYANRPDVLVLALPRGGVPVAFEVAKALNVPLDITIVRKLGLPGQPELAMGAIATGAVIVFNNDVVQYLRNPEEIIDEVATRERRELERRELRYRGDRPLPEIAGRTVLLIDDGIATGSTIRAAIKALQQQKPAHLIVAIPVAPPSV
ncbi:MAG: phosphoribosyltransferase family protein, partial [Acidobacteriota bacterium]